MKIVLSTTLALAALAVGASAVQAHYYGGYGPGCAPCCPQVCVTWVTKEVTCYKPEWRTKDVVCTYNKVVCRPVPYTYTVTCYKPVWHEETRTCTVYRTVAEKCFRDVTCSKCVPYTVTDCCGCCYTCYKRVCFTKRVPYIVHRCVPEEKPYTVKVCSYQPFKKTCQATRIVTECKPVHVTQQVKYCVMVPYTTCVKVPVCTPCAPPACEGCCY
jgi:hypothetical protein